MLPSLGFGFVDAMDYGLAEDEKGYAFLSLPNLIQPILFFHQIKNVILSSGNWSAKMISIRLDKKIVML